MKILLVISNGYVCGGAENSLRMLKHGLMQAGHDVRVLACDAGLDDPSTFSDYTFPRIKPGVRFYYKRLWNPDAYKAVRRAIKTFHPELIHYHTMGELSPSAVFAAGNTPALLTVHGPEEYTREMLLWFLESNAYKSAQVSLQNLNSFGKLEYIFYRFIQRPLYVRAFRSKLSLIVSSSKNLTDVVRREGYGVTTDMLHNGFELPAYEALPGNKVVCFVGRLSYVKGVDYLIRAMNKVTAEIPDARLRIIGDGPDRTRLETLVEELGSQDKTEFLCWQDNAAVKSFIASSQIVVIPSIWPENLPTVCIEAMAIGRPVVGTRVGGIPEMIDDAKTGYVVPPADVEVLAVAIQKILANKRRAHDMSLEARRQVQRFDVDVFVKSAERIYAKTLRIAKR